MAEGRDAWIKEQLAVEGMKDTAANRKKLGARYDKIYLGGQRSDWRTYFKLQFPQLADMLDGAEGEKNARSVFGDLIDLFIEVATKPGNFDLESEAGQQAFAARVNATQYARKTTDSQAKWDALDQTEKDRQVEKTRRALATSFASSQLTTAELNDLATLSLRNGLTELELKYAVANRLAGRPGGGALFETDEATNLRNTLRQYNYLGQVNDDILTSALTGQSVNGVEQSPELLIAKAKTWAKTKYETYAKYIDQGFTVDDIFQPFKDLAVKTLELNPVEVNLSDDKWDKVLRGKADGTPYSASEWLRELKSNPDYGWEFTDQARNSAMNMVMGLEQALGFRR